MSDIFKVRAVEIHDSAAIWNLDKIRRVLTFMVKNNMNTLIFHENEIVDKVVYPGILYGASNKIKNSYEIHKKIFYKIYETKPVPYVFIAEKLIFRDLLKIIIEEATKAGIKVYLQNKELWFPENMKEAKPELEKDGVICPSESFWWEEFLPAKYTELIENFPDLAGVVTSTGTRESKASPAHNKCHCEKCRFLKFNEWQKNVIMAIYKPLKQAGKDLVVRDFTYYSNEQDGFKDGIISLPEDIIISIKNTPQDFYPTFPHNPLLGKVGNHEQWIEYDVMGEYFGFGVVPCILLKDIKERMRYDLGKGAGGFTARVDWEALPNNSCFDTPNLLNLYGVAHLAQNTDLPLRDIYYKWLTEEKLIREELSPKELEDCLDRVMDIFEQTWPVIEKTPYINGYVFNENSKIPVSIENADFIAKELHGMQKWFPNKAEAFAITDENVKKFLEEKDLAVQKVGELYNKIKEYNPGLKTDIYETFIEQFNIFKNYVKMYELVSKAYVLIKLFQKKGKDVRLFSNKSLVETIQLTLEELKEFERQLSIYSYKAYNYPAKVLLSPERVKCFYEDAEEVFQSIQKK